MRSPLSWLATFLLSLLLGVATNSCAAFTLYSQHKLKPTEPLIGALKSAIDEGTIDSGLDSDLSSSCVTSIICEPFGGIIQKIKLENEDDGFLTAMSVPTFAAFTTNDGKDDHSSSNPELNLESPNVPTRRGLEGIIPGACIIQNVLTPQTCEEIIHACENQLRFGNFQAGKNHHGAMQVLVTDEAAKEVASNITPFIDLESVNSIAASMTDDEHNDNHIEFDVVGLNRRWRIYRYAPGGEEHFAPHIDAGFPPSTLSKDQSTLIWDALDNRYDEVIGDDDDDGGENVQTYANDTVSRLTVLMYLNDDFSGGHTKFYAPASESKSEEDEELEAIAAVKPKAGSILLFPQAVGEAAVDRAREHWPLHEGSPVKTGQRPKYVIRSDVLFTVARQGLTDEEKEDPLWKNDEVVRQAFMPRSPALSSTFLNHIRSLYNPHMGVENVGPLLYSLVRFTKVRKTVEIGAGFTTPWILQALKDNDEEMKNIASLKNEGRCLLLDIPWTPEGIVENYNRATSDKSENEGSSLLCIDNCLHQRETATGAGAVAKTLGLSDYLEFVKGDAYDMQFEPGSIDLLWCDFGVGSRMKDFAKGAWQSIRPGGFLVCHSTLTNRGTREWLEAVRSGKGSIEETGIPMGEFIELSLLEPQKRYQNSVTVLQRRKGPNGEFVEPIYSEYA